MISIIIVTYNSELLIKDCINSIIKYNDIDNYEIIIVDNSPIDGVEKIKNVLHKLSFVNIRYIHSGGNVGYGTGNNIGIKEAKGDIICIMNPDIRLAEPLFAHTETMFSSDNKLGILGYKQMGGANLSFYLRQEFFVGLFIGPIIKLFNRYNMFNQQIFHLSGAFFFCSKNSIMKIGLFDENIFMYNEEADISTRMNNLQYSIKYYPKKKYLHLIDGRERANINSTKMAIKSAVYYLKKYNFSVISYTIKLGLSYKMMILFYRLKGNKLEQKKYKELLIFLFNIKSNINETSN